MLPKKNRATTKEVKQIFKERKFITSLDLTFKYLKIKEKEVKISFIAPKNIAKLVVKRNLLRRRGYTALEKYGIPKGFYLGFLRILRCHPWQKNHIDPVK